MFLTVEKIHNLWDLFRVRVRVSVRDLKIIKWIYATKVDLFILR